jgi:hypothetical protein
MERLRDGGLDRDQVQGVVITVVCFHCAGKKRVPASGYKKTGEVVSCPICGGSGTTKKEATLMQLKNLLKNLP